MELCLQNGKAKHEDFCPDKKNLKCDDLQSEMDVAFIIREQQLPHYCTPHLRSLPVAYKLTLLHNTFYSTTLTATQTKTKH